MSVELGVALIAAVPASIAAVAAWRAARNTKSVGNGFTTHVMEELGSIKGML